MLEKVTAFIIRDQRDLLLFEHPYAGIQIPAGTVEPGEDHADAARREAHEESGLSPDTFAAVTYLGVRPAPPQYGHAFLTERVTVYAHPDPTSFDWAMIPRASMVRREGREQDGYTHVSYLEVDRNADPPIVDYQITGWVLSAALTNKRVRHFYRITMNDPTPDRWTVHTDSHDFTLFWAPLDHLPDIIFPQSTWLEVLRLDDD